ncbi:uncharacterized protein LOC111275687 [Durio zibethinus]|uniref:tRNA-uridine aminocarboxypropyltransferase n=1 Tax=Durio zibethinus TaxID=66656 RepID=A0A6P5WM17_DURZI|nr:uncharacterized protein LOC111275687 [Durio zibethinus]
MLIHFRTRIRSPKRTNPFNPFPTPLQSQIPKSSKTLKMSTTQSNPKPKRPTCPSCSKPTRVCLCYRIRTWNLDNSVSVTILQHSSERNHPLNSTRIAKLGLKNLNVVTVFEVDFEARFEIRLLEPGHESGMGRVGLESSGFGQVGGKEETQKVGSESFDFSVEGNGKCPYEKSRDLIEKNEEFSLETDVSRSAGNPLKGLNFVENLDVSSGDEVLLELTGRECANAKGSLDLIDKNGDFSLENDVNRSRKAGNSLEVLNFVETLDVSSGDELLLELTGGECGGVKGSLAMKNPCEKLGKGSNLDGNLLSEAVLDDRTDFAQNGATSNDREEPVICAMMIKYGRISDLSHIWKVDIHGKKPKFDHILASTTARDALAGGFVVKKFGRRKLDGKMEVEENEEFEVKVPPGSVLLFPSQYAVGVDDLKCMNFEVKNLIVLDGTWSKAGRIYNENPWLKLLSHLRLDLDKMSLYSEIRHQPRAGCLSTIESIVYTLKALGDNVDGLDNLLDVFESMVGDQRRLKDERLSKFPKD